MAPLSPVLLGVSLLLPAMKGADMSAQVAGSGAKAGETLCSPWRDHPHDMDCGDSVPLCGVLTMETGEGSGYYHHDRPTLHGLWPQVGRYGNSQCRKPDDFRDPQRIFPCYNNSDDTPKHMRQFEIHEWDDHGKCAGAHNASDYFQQACALASRAMPTMTDARQRGLSLWDTADALQEMGLCVWGTMSHMQIQLSACAGADGRWKLADVSDFDRLCGQGSGPAPPQEPVCVPDRHGPPCEGDADCSGVTGCVRCARSGFCTTVPL